MKLNLVAKQEMQQKVVSPSLSLNEHEKTGCAHTDLTAETGLNLFVYLESSKSRLSFFHFPKYLQKKDTFMLPFFFSLW